MKFRFDDAYEKIYRIEDDNMDYFAGYWQAGIKKSMSEKKKIKLAEELEDLWFIQEMQEQAKQEIY